MHTARLLPQSLSAAKSASVPEMSDISDHNIPNSAGNFKQTFFKMRNVYLFYIYIYLYINVYLYIYLFILYLLFPSQICNDLLMLFI